MYIRLKGIADKVLILLVAIALVFPLFEVTKLLEAVTGVSSAIYISSVPALAALWEYCQRSIK